MNISIITCTYNPDEKILTKVFDAVSNLVIPKNCTVEYTIIDNNSMPSLASLQYVNNFLNSISWSKLIVEENLGLSYARLRGFNESKGEIIVFFDDDNVPEVNYLLEVKSLFEKNSQVGIWGPGNIEVIFMDDVPKWVENGTRGLFQERKSDSIEFGYSLKPSSFHPFGTGMCLRSSIIDFYNEQSELFGFKTTGRKGNNLGSSEDTQLIYASYKKGWATGVSPSLKMKHLIPSKKTSLSYICRLHYGMDVTADMAFIESFPEFRNNISVSSNKTIIKQLLKKTISINILKKYKFYRIDIAIYIGKVIGKYRALELEEPKWLKKIANVLHLES